MSMTRRDFTRSTAAAISLTVLGCDDKPKPTASRNPDPNQARGFTTEPIDAGTSDDFRDEGVHLNAITKGVFVVNAGGSLYAIFGKCTHNGCGVIWRPDDLRFECPCHASTFDPDGANQDGGKAKRPLDRCGITIDATGAVRVDPTVMYRSDQWTDPGAAATLG